MKKNKNGFSTVEIFVVLAIFIVIGLVGWFVWSKRTDGPKNTDTSTSSRETNSSNQEDVDTDDPISKDWKRYESGKGAFSIKLADGLNGLRDTSSDFFIFRLFTSNTGAAVVKDVEGYGSDGFFALMIYEEKKSNIWMPDKNLNPKEVAFTTNSGTQGTKISYTDPYEPPCEGLGCSLGYKNVMYDFEDSKTGTVTRVWYARRIANEESKRIYEITKDDPDYTEIVDKMVKTLEIK